MTHQNYPQYAQPQYAQPAQYAQPHYAQQYYATHPPQQQPTGPLFQVAVHTHIGMLLAWHSREAKFTGTYEQCLAELKRAQLQNLLIGWWSITSIVLWNWMALFMNAASRRSLRRQAILAGVVAPPR